MISHSNFNCVQVLFNILVFSLTNSLQSIAFTDTIQCRRNRGGGGGACVPTFLEDGFCSLGIFVASKFFSNAPPPPITFPSYRNAIINICKQTYA